MLGRENADLHKLKDVHSCKVNNIPTTMYGTVCKVDSTESNTDQSYPKLLHMHPMNFNGIHFHQFLNGLPEVLLKSRKTPHNYGMVSKRDH